MSYIKSGKTADELQNLLEQTLVIMAQNQKNGIYIEAQKNRLSSQELKKDLQLRRVYQMQVRHKDQINQIDKAHLQQMNNFVTFWDKKLQDFQLQGQKLQLQMTKRHQVQIQKGRQQLQGSHPVKVKQSSQCLNLRKMQQHMVKQKNYAEAHKVQQRILQLQKQQKQLWMINRNIKIQTALNTVKGKHSAEYANLQKRIKTGREEQMKDRINQEVRLKRKYQNIRKQLRMQQEKQVLSFKGQFKSKGGQQLSPVSKSKLLGNSR